MRTSFATGRGLVRGVRLDAANLVVRAGSYRILDGISVAVRPGEFVGILGPSGSGKSTLLRTLAGQSRPAEGTVALDGVDLYAGKGEFGREVGFVPQDDIVHMTLTVQSALRFSARLRMGPRATRRMVDTRVDEVIRMLGLEKRRRTRLSKLSGGQRKRVSIGVELLTQPPLLFLDEPTSGLDPALEEYFMDLFRRLADEGRTVLLTTHVMESIDRLNLIALLVTGHLVYFGPPDAAPGFFGVDDLTDVYRKLDDSRARELESRYKGSTLFGRFVADRLAS